MSLLRTLLLFLLTAACSLSQTIGYGISINATNNELLSNSNPNYSSATEQYSISGSVVLPTGINIADFQLRVQNQFVSLTPGTTPNSFSFARPIPMGPTAPPGGWTGWAFSEHYTNDDRITRPIVAELIKTATNEVFARTRVVLLDNRRHPSMVTKSTADSVSKGLAFEVTSRGLDNLQSLAASVSPQPNLLAFNTRLTEAFRNYENSTPLNTGLTLAGKACIPVSDLPSEFRQTRAFNEFTDEVTAAYAAYQAAEATLNNTSIPASIASALTPMALVTLALQGGALYIKNQSCVRELPTRPRMELCARSLKGTTRSMSITGLGSIDLQMGTTIDLSPPNLIALNTVNSPSGVIDGSATGFFFRYSHEPNRSCANNNDTFRPTTDLPEDQIPTLSTMDSYRACNGIIITSNNATQSVGSTYQFREHTGTVTNRELHRVEHLTSPNRIFTLSPNTTNDAYKGLCNLTQFHLGADALANKFYTRLRNSLDTAWRRDDPQTQQANALDLVFAKWETGTYGDLNLIGTTTGVDHELTHNYNINESKNLTDRLFVRANTSTLTTSGGNVAVAFVDSTAQTIPCSSIGDPCPLNRNRFNNQFDLSYTVTTSSLNEMLRRLAVTNLLTLDWQPTYDELGVAPPPGTPGTAVAVLNGATLSQINPAFIAIGNNAATIRFTPTINPYTYINPEPPPTVPEGTENLTYNLPQFKMELITANSPLGDGRWLDAVIDFYDPELDLRLANLPFADRLVPTLSSQKSSRTTLLRHAFIGCQMAPVVPPIQPPPPAAPILVPTCGDQLASSLFNRFRPLLLDRLTYMLSRFPAPVNFNAGGQGNTFNVNGTDRFQWTNSITFYGNLQ